MGPFCLEQGNSSHEILKDLASTDEKTMFSGEEVGSEKEISEMECQNYHQLSNSPAESVITIIPLSNSMDSVPNSPMNNKIVQELSGLIPLNTSGDELEVLVTGLLKVVLHSL